MDEDVAKLVITKAAADALGRGQGTFSKDELAMAAADLNDCIAKGALADMVLAGKASMVVQEGEVKYTTS